jgi:ABC-2 type transport system permease protein
LTFGRLIRSEFYKLSTLKSTWWILAINAFLFPLGSAAMLGLLRFATSLSPSEIKIPQSVIWVSMGEFLSIQMILVAIFGILSFTGELSANTIQSTYAANPRRSGTYFGKAITVFVMSFGFSLVGALFAWGISEMMTMGIDTSPLPAALALKVPLVAIIGSAAAIAVMGVFGMALGGLIQSSLGAIFSVLGVLYLFPVIFGIFSIFKPEWAWSATILRILPSQAVSNFVQAGSGGTVAAVDTATVVVSTSDPDTYVVEPAMDMLTGVVGWAPTWWESGLVILGWAVVFLIVGWLVAKRRDIK